MPLLGPRLEIAADPFGNNQPSHEVVFSKLTLNSAGVAVETTLRTGIFINQHAGQKWRVGLGFAASATTEILEITEQGRAVVVNAS